MADSATPSPRQLHLLVVMRLGDVKAGDKLRPLLDCPEVGHVTLIRHAPAPLDHPKLRQVIHASKLDQGVSRMKLGRSLRNLAQCAWHGIRAARREKPDAVLGFNFTPYGVLAWLIARLTGRPALVALIGADFNTRLGQPVLGPPLRAVLRRCGRVTIFSESARRRLIASGVPAERVVVLPNTVDTRRYHPAPGTPLTHDLACTGYLIPRKGVDRLLHALHALKAVRGKPTTLLVLGDGTERENLQRLAEQLGLQDDVTFAGWSQDVAASLRRARIFVLLSEAEGLPIALLEAMSSGLPAVVADVGANAEVVRDGHNGFVVPSPAEPGVVADRLARLLDDAALLDRCRRGALEVRETHGYAHTTRRWSDIFARWP